MKIRKDIERDIGERACWGGTENKRFDCAALLVMVRIWAFF